MSLNFIADIKLLWERLQPWSLHSRAVQVVSDGERSLVGQEYFRRLRRCEKRLANTISQHRYQWVCFAGIAGAICLALYLALIAHSIPLAWLILPVMATPVVLRMMALNAREHDRAQRTVRFYVNGIARLQGEWRGKGLQGEEFRKQEGSHLYAADPDLFGNGSLFELMCTARTGIGQATLASWLLQPAEKAEILARQEAILELHNQLDLQEVWASVGAGFLDDVQSSSMRDWVMAEPTDFPILSRVCAVVLPVWLLGLVALAAFGSLSITWLPVAILALEGILAGLYLRKTREIAASIIRPSFELSLLGPLLKVMEEGSFQSSLLKAL